MRRKLRPLSEWTYKAHLKRFEAWLDGRKPSPKVAQEYLEYLASEGKASNTLATAANALHWWYGFKLQRPKITLGEPRYLSLEEVNKLLDSCENLLQKTVITLLFDGGLRISELLSLKVNEIDWQNGVITVTRKGGYTARVKLTERGVEALREWLSKRRSKSPMVFMDHDYKSLYGELKRLARKAGIPDFTPHKLRHSRAVHLLESGVPLERVSDILGHRSIETTAKIYGRLRAEELGKYLKEW